MAIAKLSSYSSNFASATTATTTATTSYTIPNGAVAIIAVTIQSTATITVSDSASRTYTRIATVLNNGTNKAKVEMWRYVNTSGSSISVTPKITLSTTGKRTYTAEVFSGANTSSPIGATYTTGNGNASSNAPFAGITSTVANSYMVVGYGATGTPTFMVDSTDTQLVTVATTGNSSTTNTRGVLLHDNITNGAIGTALSTAGTWSVNSYWASVGVELKPTAPTTYTKTHTADSRLIKNATKTHTTSSFLGAAFLRTHTTSSYLRKTIPGSHSTDALSKARLIKDHSTDTLKRKANSKTHTTSAVKRGAYSKFHTTSSVTKTIPTKTHTSNALKRGAYSKTHTTSALLRKGQLLTHTSSSVKHTSPEKLHTTDSLLSNALKTLELETYTDSLLRGGYWVSHGAYSTLKVIKEYWATTNALLRAVTTKTHTTSAFIRREDSKTHDTDSLLRLEGVPYSTSDALLRVEKEVNHTSSSYLYQEQVMLLSHDTDASIRSEAFGQWSDIWDYTVVEFSTDHDTDSLLRGRQLLTHSSNSLIKAVNQLTHTADSNFKKSDIEISHTADTYIRPALEKSHTTDTYLISRAQTHTTDSYLRHPNTVSHRTSSNLAKIITHNDETILVNGRPAKHITGNFYIKL